jgi:hypothetical protein
MFLISVLRFTQGAHQVHHWFGFPEMPRSCLLKGKEMKIPSGSCCEKASCRFLASIKNHIIILQQPFPLPVRHQQRDRKNMETKRAFVQTFTKLV